MKEKKIYKNFTDSKILFPKYIIWGEIASHAKYDKKKQKKSYTKITQVMLTLLKRKETIAKE